MSSPILSYSSDRYRTNPADKHIRYLDENAILYRLVADEWYDEEILLDAEALSPVQTRGRWNRAKQGTIYAANNILICFAERLYHMYIGAMNNLSANKCSCEVEPKYLERKHQLAIVAVKKIERLAHLLDATTYTRLRAGLRGSLLIHPYPENRHLHRFAGRLRKKYKRKARWDGIAYPSARHRTDPLSSDQEWYSAYALFNNESEKVIHKETAMVTLKLISDVQDLNVRPDKVEPHLTHFLHASIGYFEFDSDSETKGNEEKVKELRDSGLLMPALKKNFGYIDFIRRTYKSYPDDAVI